jgi:4-amino-4-deoxy-L-arabinose transferase-like glycosyltransferase
MREEATKPSNHSSKLVYFIIFLYFTLICISLPSTSISKGDERFYLVSGMNMVKSGDYLIPRYDSKPRLQKPILAYWCVAAGYRLFGINLLGGRIFSTVAGCLLLLLVYHFSLRMKEDLSFAIFNTVLLSSSTMFILFSRAAMTDLLLSLFVTFALYYFYRSLINPSKIEIFYILAFTGMGFGFLSKGWIALTPLAVMLIYLLVQRPDNSKEYFRKLFHPIPWLILLIVGSGWFAIAYWNDPQAFTQTMGDESYVSTDFENVLRNGPYYLGVLLRYFFPVTLLTILVAILRKEVRFMDKTGLLLIFIAVILVIFIFLIDIRRSRFLLPLFPSLAIVCGTILYHSRMRRTVQGICFALFLIQVIGIGIISPAIRGEPMQELMTRWNPQRHGPLIIFDLDLKNRTWAEILSQGNQLAILEEIEDIDDYLEEPRIAVLTRGEDSLKLLTGNRSVELIDRSEEIQNITIENGGIRLVKEEYYLLSIVQAQDHISSRK